MLYKITQQCTSKNNRHPCQPNESLLCSRIYLAIVYLSHTDENQIHNACCGVVSRWGCSLFWIIYRENQNNHNSFYLRKLLYGSFFFAFLLRILLYLLFHHKFMINDIHVYSQNVLVANKRYQYTRTQNHRNSWTILNQCFAHRLLLVILKGLPLPNKAQKPVVAFSRICVVEKYSFDGIQLKS